MADDRGISARIGRPWTSGGDVPVDRLMWQAVCVVGRRLAGGETKNLSACLPVINHNVSITLNNINQKFVSKFLTKFEQI